MHRRSKMTENKPKAKRGRKKKKETVEAVPTEAAVANAEDTPTEVTEAAQVTEQATNNTKILVKVQNTFLVDSSVQDPYQALFSTVETSLNKFLNLLLPNCMIEISKLDDDNNVVESKAARYQVHKQPATTEEDKK